tara:strand:+ start:7 stop:129 length:123 start_codon:yes stop_codon:yes gene_type:complete
MNKKVLSLILEEKVLKHLTKDAAKEGLSFEQVFNKSLRRI